MSGLHLFRAARVEALAATLATNLTQYQPANPFAPLTISVGNKGMERWLRSLLAVHLGIAANLKFPFPRGAVTSLLAMQEAEDEPWQRDALAWRVLTAMDTLHDDAALQPLVQWLQAQPGVDQTPSGALQRSRWTLATEIASVLDRVAVYRPDWLQAWSQGTAVPEQDAAGIPAWQPALWRALQDQVAGRHPSLRLLAAEPQAGDALHVFAVSSLPRVWLETLRRAAQFGVRAAQGRAVRRIAGLLLVAGQAAATTKHS
jgi:exodeoxyribonuclease V gamma subunit